MTKKKRKEKCQLAIFRAGNCKNPSFSFLLSLIPSTPFWIRVEIVFWARKIYSEGENEEASQILCIAILQISIMEIIDYIIGQDAYLDSTDCNFKRYKT